MLQIGVHSFVADGIDPNESHRRTERWIFFLACRHLIQRGCYLLTGGVLRRGSHTIFDIHQDGIDGKSVGFVDHLLAISRNKHPGTYEGKFLIHSTNLSNRTWACRAHSGQGKPGPYCCSRGRPPRGESLETSFPHRSPERNRTLRTSTCKRRP